MNAIILDFIFNNRYVLTALLWFVAILPVIFLIRSSKIRKLDKKNKELSCEILAIEPIKNKVVALEEQNRALLEYNKELKKHLELLNELQNKSHV